MIRGVIGQANARNGANHPYFDELAFVGRGVLAHAASGHPPLPMTSPRRFQPLRAWCNRVPRSASCRCRRSLRPQRRPSSPQPPGRKTERQVEAVKWGRAVENTDRKGAVMSFSVLPPEVNSARMFAGPGAGPLWAASGGVGRDWRRVEFCGRHLQLGNLRPGGRGMARPCVGADDEGSRPRTRVG